MICDRCGDEHPNVLPSPFVLVTMSGPTGGRTWIFCVERCAPVLEAWLDHKWTSGQDAVQVSVDANGQLT